MAATAVGLPAAPPVRNRTMLVGTGFVCAAIAMYFAGLFGVYFTERSAANKAGTEWLAPDANVQLTSPTIIIWGLLISVFFMQWAIWSIARDDRQHGYIAIGMLLVFGAAVVVQTSFQWDEMGLRNDEAPSSALIYAISGSFMVLLVCAMLFVALVGFRALAGQYSSKNTDGLVAASYVWYLMIFIYFIMWIGIFIAK